MPMKPTSPTGLTLKSVLFLTSLSVAACSPAGHAPELLLEEPVMLDGAAIVTAKSARRKAAHAPAKSGVLTAGDIDDTLNLSSFLAYQNAAKRRTKLPMTNLSKPVLAKLRDKGGTPASHVRYTLRKPNASQPFYDGYAGVDGNITVFPAALGAGRLAAVELRAFPEGQGTPLIQTLKSTGARHQITLPFAATSTPDFLDLTFVVDTTGSMADELDWLTKELQSIVRAARKTAPKVDMRFGLIVYRDQGDDYVVRNYGFTKSVRHMKSWLQNQNAAGGGDYPEAAAAALSEGAAMNWRRGNGERLMFHIADAPAHSRDARAYLEAAASAAAKGVQIFGLGASGVAAESEYLMRQAAVQTAGRYLFLTDDSGVGHGHAEPTISCYQVSDLTGLMTRVLKSELSGVRIEAHDAQILRRVGSYTAGVCQG